MADITGLTQAKEMGKDVASSYKKSLTGTGITAATGLGTSLMSNLTARSQAATEAAQAKTQLLTSYREQAAKNIAAASASGFAFEGSPTSVVEAGYQTTQKDIQAIEDQQSLQQTYLMGSMAQDLATTATTVDTEVSDLKASTFGNKKQLK